MIEVINYLLMFVIVIFVITLIELFFHLLFISLIFIFIQFFILLNLLDCFSLFIELIFGFKVI
jgi:hypothetical protein